FDPSSALRRAVVGNRRTIVPCGRSQDSARHAPPHRARTAPVVPDRLHADAAGGPRQRRMALDHGAGETFGPAGAREGWVSREVDLNLELGPGVRPQTTATVEALRARPAHPPSVW